jgi:hypothetical protein
MAPTRPLQRAQVECAKTAPLPRNVTHPPVEIKSSFSKREELEDTLVLNLKKNSKKLPSATDGEKDGGRDSVLPTLKKTLLNFKHGNDGHTLWALRAVDRIKHCLCAGDLWNVIGALAVGAKNEAGVKSEHMRAACLEAMVVLHGEISKRTIEEGKVAGKKNAGNQPGLKTGDIVPPVDSRAVEQAVAEEAEERRDRVLFEGMMADAIINILENEGCSPSLRGAAERAVYEIDSPLLRQMVVSNIDEMQKQTGLMWGDLDEGEVNRERTRDLILLAYLADIETAEAGGSA